MNRSWSFDLPFERAPKGLSANDRSHWSVKAKSTADVRTIVAHKCLLLINEPLGRVRVDVEWVVNTRHRRDTDNLAPFMKAIYDGIGADRGLSARIVLDDSPEYMEKFGATIRYQKDATPHFTVKITELARLGGETNG